MQNEEDTIQALLRAAAADTSMATSSVRNDDAHPPPFPATVPAAKESEDEIRDRLVIDAACGAQQWRTEVSTEEIDYTEQRADGAWSASVSVVVTLVRSVRGCAEEEDMHDETGSGRAVGADEAAAIAAAQQRAVVCARRRLAKRFAHSLEPARLAEIARQATKSGDAVPGNAAARSHWSSSRSPAEAGGWRRNPLQQWGGPRRAIKK
jgi:hypothetical protein